MKLLQKTLTCVKNWMWELMCWQMSLENDQLQKTPVGSKKYQSATELYPDAYFSGRAQLCLMFEHLNLDIQLLWQGKYLATPLFRLWNAVDDDFHDYCRWAEPINHFEIVVEVNLLLTIDVDYLVLKKICPVEPCYHFWN